MRNEPSRERLKVALSVFPGYVISEEKPACNSEGGCEKLRKGLQRVQRAIENGSGNEWVNQYT
jgi:hypothetical protein